jgi:phospholipid transport system substrate-binding protein
MAVAVFLLTAAAHAAPADDAAAVIERLYTALVEVATAEPQPSLARRVETLAPVIASTHDLTAMGRLTVRRFWNDWSESQRERFAEAFASLSITTYASRFAGVGPDTFAVLGGETVGDNRAEVRAVIRRPDAEDVPMEYLLQLEESGWRIVNVEADGVSELSLMRSKYFDVLESGDFDDLIAELDAETEAL